MLRADFCELLQVHAGSGTFPSTRLRPKSRPTHSHPPTLAHLRPQPPRPPPPRRRRHMVGTPLHPVRGRDGRNPLQQALMPSLFESGGIPWSPQQGCLPNSQIRIRNVRGGFTGGTDCLGMGLRNRIMARSRKILAEVAGLFGRKSQSVWRRM